MMVGVPCHNCVPKSPSRLRTQKKVFAVSSGISVLVFVAMHVLNYTPPWDRWRLRYMDEFEALYLGVDLSSPEQISARNRTTTAIMERLRQTWGAQILDTLLFNIDLDAELRNTIAGSPFDPIANITRSRCWIGAQNSGNPYQSDVFYRERFAQEKSRYQQFMESLRKRFDEGVRWRMRCLPSVFQIGVSKSGTSDLSDHIKRHPQVSAALAKEQRWWNRERIGSLRFTAAEAKDRRATLSEYLDHFDMAADVIRRPVYTPLWQHNISDIITLDNTPHYLWDYDGWETLAGNLGLKEPRYILPHTLKVFVPEARFIVILRNPATRLYSQFRMLSPREPPEVFARLVNDSLRRWTDCASKAGIRSCAYSGSLIPYEYKDKGYKQAGITLRASLYHIFLNDWMQVYPKDRFFVIKAEDYYQNRTSVLSQLFQFLELRDLSASEWDTVSAGKVRNSHKKRNALEEIMLRSTWETLRAFFMPFNQRLVGLLRDKRFLWTDSQYPPA